MGLLETIKSPSDIKEFNLDKLRELANEIRLEIIDTVLINGGHLASSLGAVELIIALHYVFNTPLDKLIFDVGHQAYAHKLLTGRFSEFKTLRKLGGISGFPRRLESEYDAFNAGHSGTAISAASGMARARCLLGQKFNIISIVGDASLTNGMSFEALNDAGARENKQIIILNDNNMSISHNVGAVSRRLNKLRHKNIYKNAKKTFIRILNSITPGESHQFKLLKKVKNSIKYAFMDGILFEEFGFKYIGPIDGHDIEEIIRYLELAKEEESSILIHIVTKKGRGCIEAEKSPHLYHGMSSIGAIKNGKSYSKVLGEELTAIALTDTKIVAVTAAMRDGTGLDSFYKAYPDRFFDVGIAEEHAVTMCAGLASCGYKPYFAVYSSFLQRAYDQIIHDVAMQGLPVRLCVDRAGLVGEDGETHQGIFDLSFLSTIPGLTIVAPMNIDEFVSIIKWSKDYEFPLAIRYPKGSAGALAKTEFVPLKWSSISGDDECDAYILVVGATMCSEVEVADGILHNRGYSINVINARFVRPLDTEILDKISNKPIITVEDNIMSGGFGMSVAEYYISKSKSVNLNVISFPNTYIPHGTIKELLSKYDLLGSQIAERIENILKK